MAPLTKHRWRLLNNGAASGAWNMAVDEAIMEFCRQGRVPPTLRFYCWQPPCLSIGYFQEVGLDVDISKCLDLGIDLVRRPSGGKSILHDKEVTYSVASSEDDVLISGNIAQSHRKISAAILQGLHSLGVKAEVGNSTLGLGESLRTAACFNMASEHEITVDGKKLVGSAQVRRERMILQHGSIPLSLDSDKLFSVLKFSDEGQQQREIEHFRKRAISLEESLGRKPELDEVVLALKRGFEEALGVLLAESVLTSYEVEAAEKLVREKYCTMGWNLERRECKRTNK